MLHGFEFILAYINMFHLLDKLFDSGILVCGMSTIWEVTNGCSNKYRYALAIHLMTVLSSSYGIITNRAINSPGHVNNFADGINEMDKCYLNEQM